MLKIERNKKRCLENRSKKLNGNFCNESDKWLCYIKKSTLIQFMFTKLRACNGESEQAKEKKDIGKKPRTTLYLKRFMVSFNVNWAHLLAATIETEKIFMINLNLKIYSPIRQEKLQTSTEISTTKKTHGIKHEKSVRLRWW